MKNIIRIIIVTLVLFPAVISAQGTKTAKQKAMLDRSVRPQPGPAPEIKIGHYESFTLDNGLKVFVVENHKIPRVAYSLIVDYTPTLEGDKAGLADLFGELLRTGTTNLTKDQLDEEIDFIGASISTSRNSINASGLKKHNEKLMQLVSDILVNPAFDGSQLEKIKTRALSALEAEKNDPGSISKKISSQLVYGSDHPYGESITEESIKNISAEDCRGFYSTYFRPQISYLAIVGDISLAEAKEVANKYFGSWQKNDLSVQTLPKPNKPEANVVAIVDRPDAVQTTLSVNYPVDLHPGSEDVIKARVTNTILGGGTFRLFNNLREQKGYTYGAYSRLNADKYIGSFSASTEIRNSVTDSALVEILNEMKRIQEEPVPADELALAKNFMAGNFALSLENPQTIAGFAINTARYDLPSDYYVNYLKNLSSVTSDDVKAMASKYILPNKSYVLAVGKGTDIAPKLQPFTSGKIRYFDVEGNEYDPDKKVKPAPAGMTGADVNEAYINAIGGRKVLEKVKDITINATTSMQGMTIGIDIYQKAPNKYMMKIGAGDMVFQKMVYNGTEGSMSIPMQNQNKKLEGEELERIKMEAVINPELIYDQLGIKLTLEGIEQINGVDAYKVVISNPDGSEETRYFDTTTNLLIHETNDQGVSEFSDYRVINNIKFPFTIKQSLGAQAMEMEVLSVKINQKLKDELFTL